MYIPDHDVTPIEKHDITIRIPPTTNRAWISDGKVPIAMVDEHGDVRADGVSHVFAVWGLLGFVGQFVVDGPLSHVVHFEEPGFVCVENLDFLFEDVVFPILRSFFRSVVSV